MEFERDGKKFMKFERDGRKFMKFERDGRKLTKFERDGRKFTEFERDGRKFTKFERDGRNYFYYVFYYVQRRRGRKYRGWKKEFLRSKYFPCIFSSSFFLSFLFQFRD